MFLEFNKDNIKYEIVDTVGSGSLKGTVYTTYAKLNELFGEPTVNDANPNEKDLYQFDKFVQTKQCDYPFARTC